MQVRETASDVRPGKENPRKPDIQPLLWRVELPHPQILIISPPPPPPLLVVYAPAS